jgi:hypothetical protein
MKLTQEERDIIAKASRKAFDGMFEDLCDALTESDALETIDVDPDNEEVWADFRDTVEKEVIAQIRELLTISPYGT